MRAPKTGRLERRDDLSPLWLRITASGDRSFTVRVRIKGCVQPVRITFPERAHASNLVAAREWALKIDAQCRAGTDPRRELAMQAHLREECTVEKVADRFIATNGVHKKNARGWKPRTVAEYARILNTVFKPRWKGRAIHTISRDEITDLLDEVAETAPIAANRAFSTLSAMMNWYGRQRGSGFTSPIVRGMAPSAERSRDRTLDDDELRLVWAVAGKTGIYGSFVRVLLLTAARRSEGAGMCHSHIGSDGIWALGSDRSKTWETLYLPLPPAALAIIDAQPRLDEQDLVFSFTGEHEMQNWSHNKAAFDERVLRRMRAYARATGGDPAKVEPLPNWTHHDLRRTARSLMARARVPSEHAERVLNHKIEGVEGVYDRHSYEDEKREALEQLERLLMDVVNARPGEVVRFMPRAAA